MNSTIELLTVIDQIVPTLGDWCPKTKAETLAAQVVALRPAISLEIGVWLGASLIPMAMAHKFIGYGKVIAVDPWNAEASACNESPDNQNWWRRQDHEKAFQMFRNTVEFYGLKDVVEIQRKCSDEYDPPDGIGLLHIDGSHTIQAVRDVERYASKVSPGGICIMDDIEWVGGGVLKAVDLLQSMGFRRLYPLIKGAVFQR